jgi:hypothetical protein
MHSYNIVATISDGRWALLFARFSKLYNEQACILMLGGFYSFSTGIGLSAVCAPSPAFGFVVASFSVAHVSVGTSATCVITVKSWRV